MSDIELRLFGGFDVRCGDAPVRRFESQKARGLLAYLALHRGQALSRERVAALLWSDKDESSARRNLRQVLYSLRTAFAEADLKADLLVGEAQAVALNPELDLSVDVDGFESAIEAGLDGAEPDSQQLGQAARLYIGDFLSGFFVRDCPPFEDWLIETQERLRESALTAFHTLVDSCLQRGESRMGIHYARRLLSIDPLSERAHRHLMRLYAQSGRRTRAMAQFEELRNLLNQELGVEPLAETTALYRTILFEDLPTEDATDEPIGPLIPLAGRGEELAELQGSWQRGPRRRRPAGAAPRRGRHRQDAAGQELCRRRQLATSDAGAARPRLRVLSGGRLRSLERDRDDDLRRPDARRGDRPRDDRRAGDLRSGAVGAAARQPGFRPARRTPAARGQRRGAAGGIDGGTAARADQRGRRRQDPGDPHAERLAVGRQREPRPAAGADRAPGGAADPAGRHARPDGAASGTGCSPIPTARPVFRSTA